MRIAAGSMNCAELGAVVKEEKSDRLVFAVAAIISTTLVASLSDAAVKLLSSEISLWQLFVLRSFLAIPVLFYYMVQLGQVAFSERRTLVVVFLRSVLLVGMWISFFLYLSNLSLAEATTVLYTYPVFIVLWSVFVLREKIGFAGRLAVISGFAGILFVIQPEVDRINLYTVLPLLSSIFYATAMLLTRTKCRSCHPAELSLALNVTFVLVGTVMSVALIFVPDAHRTGFMFSPWIPMDFQLWFVVGLLAVAQIAMSVGIAIAYQSGPSPMISVLAYTQVGFAFIWGLVFFSEVPDTVSIFGIFLIIAAGLLSLKKPSTIYQCRFAQFGKTIRKMVSSTHHVSGLI